MNNLVDLDTHIRQHFSDRFGREFPGFDDLVDYVAGHLSDARVPREVAQCLITTLYYTFEDRGIVPPRTEIVERLGVAGDEPARKRLMGHARPRYDADDMDFSKSLVVFVMRVNMLESAAVERQQGLLIFLYTSLYAMFRGCDFDPWTAGNRT
jgi:hypothetical protein